MGVKTWLAVGLTSVALGGGGAWAYVHYTKLYGGGCASHCAPAPACEQPVSAENEVRCDETCDSPAAAGKSCCDAPSRTNALLKE